MSYEAKIEAAIGTVIIDVPDDVGVKIHVSTALVTRSLPSGYTESVDNVFTSPNYEQAEHKIELFVNLAIGTVTVK
jgi:predicted membrane protein